MMALTIYWNSYDGLGQAVLGVCNPRKQNFYTTVIRQTWCRVNCEQGSKYLSIAFPTREL